MLNSLEVQAELQYYEYLITAGPRRPGEGTENEQQGIIGAVQLPGAAASLHITLLAAGFVIGRPHCSCLIYSINMLLK